VDDVTHHLNYWKSRLGNYELVHLTAELIGKERQHLANIPTNKNLKRSAATVNRYLSSLSALFSHAVSLRWIDENPCFRLTKLKENPGRDRVLSEDEVSNLLTACRQSKSLYLYTFVLMSLTTGARQGEIMGLEWRHVDFENKLAYLKETKNGRPRSISLADSILTELRLWDSFYDSLIQFVPSLDNGLYRQVFTCFSLLEAIGEGQIRTQYTPKLNLNKFLLCNSDALSEDLLEDSESEYQILGTQLDKATLFAVNYYKSHPGLSKENLLSKIEEQLHYSTSNAAEDLIKNTLIRYKQSILNDYESFLDKISLELTWDSICSFDFFRLDKKSNQSNELFRKQFTRLKKMLLHVFHDGQVNGRDLGSFRLCEAIHRERLISKEFIKKIESEHGNKKYKISISGMLKEEHDLCDVDVIHYATLGYYDPEFQKSFPVKVFTSDDRRAIKTRVLL